MPSPESAALYNVFKQNATLLRAHPELAQNIPIVRVLSDSLANYTAEPTDVTYEAISIPSSTGAHPLPALWHKPLSASKNHVIPYLRGGGFVTNSTSSHRKLVGHLAKATGSYALGVD